MTGGHAAVNLPSRRFQGGRMDDGAAQEEEDGGDPALCKPAAWFPIVLVGSGHGENFEFKSRMQSRS